jgi:hypothetical protein
VAESKSNLVKFDHFTWIASRPQVLPVLKNIAVCPAWGLAIDFHGTDAELIAAGIATADMFEDIGKSRQRTRRDSYGDQYTVKRRCGKWDLELRLSTEGSQEPPSDERPDKCPWWIKHGSEAEAATAVILARFARRPPAPL